MPSITDFVVALTQMLRNSPLSGFALWVQKTPPSMFADKHFWVVPSLQVVHILAIAMLFASAVMINMRIVMLAGRSRTMAQTVQRYLPWIWWGLLVLLITGVGLTFSDPIRELTNPFFWSKMILVVVAVLVNLGFQTSVSRHPAQWESTHGQRIAVRIGAAGGIVLWCAIMALGRWIAYAPT
jgi:uncharacterized membrane protein SirB2